METTELEKGTASIASICNSIAVTNEDEFKKATELVLKIDAEIKIRNDFLEKEKTDAHKLWKSLCAKLNQLVDPLEEGRQTVKRKIEAFLNKKEQERRAEQDRINAAEAARVQKERKALEEKIDKAQASGKDDKAEALREKLADVDVTPVIVQSSIAKTTQTGSGSVSTRPDVDVFLLEGGAIAYLKEVVEGRAPITSVEIKMGAVKKFVVAHQIKHFPGITIMETKRASFRGAHA